MTFRRVPISEWSILEDKLISDPLNFMWYDSLVISRCGMFPSMEFRVYSYKVNGSIYLYGRKINKYIEDSCLTTCIGTFNSTDFTDGFKMFLQVEPVLEEPMFIVKSWMKYTDLINDYLRTLHGDYEIQVDLFNYFYMDKLKEDKVLDWKCPAPPDGYTLGEPIAEQDYELINSTWNKGCSGELFQTKEKLLHLPSSCIRYEGEPVSYEMLDHHGYLNHQFTHVQHRRKGLGSIVELDLAQKVIRKGLKVYKIVFHKEEKVIEASLKCEYWSMVEDDNMAFLIVTKK